jgi:hypothetical protein
MRYAFFNSDGRVELAVNDERCRAVPAGAVELSEADWNRRFDLRMIAGVLEHDPLPPPMTLADLKAAALAAIDAEAGVARARYITVAPGQEATYILKAQQATAFKAGGYAGAVPGLVQAEMDATGATAQQAADDILAQEATWAYKAAQIESARRRGKVAAGNAADAAAVDAARAAAIAELGAL